MKMKWYHRRRLHRLADKLEGKGPYAKVGPVPAHKFDMLNLFSATRGRHGITEANFNPTHCKTAACAYGWAMSDPWFKQRRISLADLGSDFFGLGLNWAHLFIADSYLSGRKVKASTVAARLREVADSAQ